MSEHELEPGQYVAQLSVTTKAPPSEREPWPLVYDDNGNPTPDMREPETETVRFDIANIGGLGELLFGLHEAISGLDSDTQIDALVILDADRRMVLKCHSPIDLANALISGQSHDINRFQHQAEQLAAENAALANSLADTEKRVDQMTAEKEEIAGRLEQTLKDLQDARALVPAESESEGKETAPKSTGGNTKDALKLRNPS